MTQHTGNTMGRKEQHGSSNPNMQRQKDKSRDPNHGDARDRTGRKGGDNEKNL